MSKKYPSYLTSLCSKIFTLYELLNVFILSHNSRIDKKNKEIQISNLKYNKLIKNMIPTQELKYYELPMVVSIQDPADYLDFLHETIVGFNSTSVSKEQFSEYINTIPFITEPAISQLNIIKLIVAELFNKSSNSSHMLTLGYSHNSFYNKLSNGNNCNDSGIRNTHANFLWYELCNKNWTLLLNRIGDHLMKFLLMDCLIFKSIGKSNNLCMVQICGPCISGLVRKYNNTIFNVDLTPKPQTKLIISKQQKSKLKSFNKWTVTRSLIFYSSFSPSAVKTKTKHFDDDAGLPLTNPLNQIIITRADEKNILIKYIFQRVIFGTDLNSAIFFKQLSKDSSEAKEPISQEDLPDLLINNLTVSNAKIPSRLYKVKELFAKLVKNHFSLPYKLLLIESCPLKSLRVNSNNTEEIKSQSESDISSTGSSNFNDKKCEVKDSNIKYSNVRNFNNFETNSFEPNSNDNLLKLLSCNSSYDQIFNFVKNVILRLVPYAFFGNDFNRNLIFKKISIFISLRCSESLTVHNIMQNIQINNISWLYGLNPNDLGIHEKQQTSNGDNIWRTEIYAQFLYYMFQDIVVPLLGANFYVTETEHYKNKTLYYRRSVWKKIFKHFVANSVCQSGLKMYKFIKTSEAESALESRSSTNLGYGSLRLLPRNNGIRPLVNLSSKYEVYGSANEKKSAVNDTLRPVFQTDTRLFGASVFGPIDMFNNLFSFISSFKKLSKKPKVYIACSDIQKCFDNIERNKLWEILKSIFVEDDYVLMKFYTICQKSLSSVMVDLEDLESQLNFSTSEFIPPSNSNKRKIIISNSASKRYKSKDHLITADNIIKSRSTISVCTSSDKIPFCKMIAKTCDERYAKVIFQDAVTYEKCFKNEIMRVLHHHVFNNIVKIRGSSCENQQYVLQMLGTPQGSVLSTYFACAVLGYIERNLLLPNLKVFGVTDFKVIRNVDDYLMLSTDIRPIKYFIEEIQNGFPEYGVHVNKQKTRTNFSSDFEMDTPDRILTKNEIWIPWCGMIINQLNLDIRADYNRLTKNDVSDLLRIDPVRKPGANLARQLKSYIFTKCHAIYFHRSTQSPYNLRLNVYQLFLFSAVKTLAHLNALQNYGIRSIKSHSTEFILNSIIFGCVDHFYSLIKMRMRVAFRNKNNKTTFAKGNSCQMNWFKFSDHYPLPSIDTSWLALHAYYDVFSKEPTKWKTVLTRIYNLLWHNKNYNSSRISLKSIVSNPKNYSIFNSITI